MRTNNTRQITRTLRRHPLVFLSLSIYALFNILALIWLVSTSLKGSSEILSTSPWSLPEAFKWENYQAAWTIGKIGTYLVNSLVVTSVATFVTLVLASLSGYIFARVKFPGIGLLRAGFMAAMMIPPFAIVVPLFDILSQFSLLNSRVGLTLVYVAMQLPLNTFILTSFHQTLPIELEEASSIDGASPSQTFFRIVLPLTGSALLACGVVNVLHIWNEFIYALTFIQDQDLYTLPVGIFSLSQLADYSSNWPILFAGMVISILPILIVFAIFQRGFSSGISQGALKL